MKCISVTALYQEGKVEFYLNPDNIAGFKKVDNGTHTSIFFIANIEGRSRMVVEEDTSIIASKILNAAVSQNQKL